MLFLNYTCIIGVMQKKETTLAIIAIVAALGLLGVVVVEGISTPQHQADARGCTNGLAFNASKGRCFGH
jgi:hypothetical protein